MTASFQILFNSSFTYHPIIRRYIVLLTEKRRKISYKQKTPLLHGKLTFYGRVLKSVKCLALACKTAGKTRIMVFFFKSFGAKKIN
jgi:hypothetical protein